MGGYEAGTCSLKANKSGFRAVRCLLQELRAQVIFSFLLPAVGKDIERNRKILSINARFYGLCYQQNFGLFGNRMPYVALSLQAQDGFYLSPRGKRVSGEKLAGLIGRSLN